MNTAAPDLLTEKSSEQVVLSKTPGSLRTVLAPSSQLSAEALQEEGEHA